MSSNRCFSPIFFLSPLSLDAGQFCAGGTCGVVERETDQTREVLANVHKTLNAYNAGGYLDVITAAKTVLAKPTVKTFCDAVMNYKAGRTAPRGIGNGERPRAGFPHFGNIFCVLQRCTVCCRSRSVPTGSLQVSDTHKKLAAKHHSTGGFPAAA